MWGSEVGGTLAQQGIARKLTPVFAFLPAARHAYY
jgi:hypothetical protein